MKYQGFQLLGTTYGLVYFWISVQSEQNMAVSWMNPEVYQFMMTASQTFNQNFSITALPTTSFFSRVPLKHPTYILLVYHQPFFDPTHHTKIEVPWG